MDHTVNGMYRRASVALTILAVVLLAVTAITAGATAASPTPASESPETASNTTGPAQTAVSEVLSNATGNTTVVASLPDRSPETFQTSSHDSPATAMQAHAASSQSPLERFAADNPHVTIDRQLWLTNAVVLTVDTDHVPLERIVGIDNVQRLHEDYHVTVSNMTTAEPSSESTPAEPASETTIKPPSVSTTANATTTTTASNVGATRAIKVIDVPTAWQQFDTRGEGVRVAVLDTGVNPSHPDIDIEDRNWACYIECSADGPHDNHGHGTYTSGTVVGGDANDAGLQIGVAPDATLMHGKVLGSRGGSFSSIVSGMQWAVTNDADVISMSLGANGKHDAFISPVRNAQASGAIVIAAIGNSGSGTSSTPGNVYDSTSVGAVNVEPDFPSRGTFGVADGRVWSYSGGERVERSDWGETPADWPDSYVVPDVSAPGNIIWSADTRHDTATCGNVETTDLTCAAGTSAATPHVAGTVALMLSASSADHSPAELQNTLETTAVDINEAATRQGAGRINATAAVAAVADSRPPGDEPRQPQDGPVAEINVSTAPSSVGPGELFDVTFTVANTGDANAYTGGIRPVTPAGITGSNVFLTEGIEAGAQKTKTVSFETDGSIDSGEYTITAEAVVGESTDSVDIPIGVTNGNDLSRFDQNDNGRIDFQEVINAINASNNDRQIGGGPVSFGDVLTVISAFNQGIPV